MKNLLLASTALLGFASVAAAETGVNISGFGRFGLTYDSSRSDPVLGTPGASDTIVETRLRFNIDATTETDSGVTFGGRIRIQYDEGTSNSAVSPALLYVSYEGLRVEVGNANTAFDSAALIYDSELGLTDSSFGDSRSSFYSFTSGGYGTDNNRMGVFASYSMNGFSGKISYITADQTGVTAVNEETSIALSYENDMFTVSAAAAQDGAGIAGNDIWFLGGAYKGLANTTIGLNYIDEGDDGTGTELGTTVVLYANYTMGATTLKGYIANNDYVNNQTDTALGIGADYDLGGAKLTGGIHRDYNEETFADLGVRFDF